MLPHCRQPGLESDPTAGSLYPGLPLLGGGSLGVEESLMKGGKYGKIDGGERIAMNISFSTQDLKVSTKPSKQLHICSPHKICCLAKYRK